MLEPRADGPYESWEELMPTLTPILSELGNFLPWSSANREVDKNETNFSVERKGKFTHSSPKNIMQSPCKY